MKTAILIAVRMKSARLPKKALKMIGGQTVIENLIDRIKKSKEADEIVLCTSTHPDDAVLLEIADKKGIKKFAGSEEDVLDRFIKAAERVNADRVVRVTGDNPLTDPEHIDKMLKKQEETGAEYVYLEGMPSGTKGEVMTVDALKKAKKLAYDSNQSEYMTIYFRSGLFDINKVEAEENVRRPDYRLTIDTPKDLKLMQEISSHFEKELPEIKLEEIIEYLDKNPEAVSINKDAHTRKVDKEIIETEEGKKVKIIVK